MHVEITILVDNQSAVPGLPAAHGFAAFVDVEGRALLFDTGPSALVVENAERLGVALERVEWVVLSHGHWDHAGGLAAVLERAPAARLVLHPHARVSRWSVAAEKAPRAVGIPAPALRAMQAAHERTVQITAPSQLWPGVWASGPIPRVHAFEDPGGPFFLDVAGTRPDVIPDDQSLWLCGSEDLLVLVGCAHAGVLNSIEHARGQLPPRDLAAVIGGMHLQEASEERLEATTARLAELRPGILVPAHCSGELCSTLFRARLGDVVQPSGVGARFSFCL